MSTPAGGPEDVSPVAPLRVLFVCSTGGHLAQLAPLLPWARRQERLWVTFDKEDARSVLAGETVCWAFHPTTRNVPNLLRNTWLAWKVLRRYRPQVVISTGAGVAIPFFLLARPFRARTVFVEVYDRIDSPTVTGRAVQRFCDILALQWDEQLRQYPGGTVVGRLM